MSRWYHPGTDSYHTILGTGYNVNCHCATEDTIKQVIYWSDALQEWQIVPQKEFLSGAFIPLGPGGAPLPPEVSFPKS